MRTIAEHIVNPANDKLLISVDDESGPGGAAHRYIIEGFDSSTNPSFSGTTPIKKETLLFQNGDIAEVGVNGITHEVLLAIVVDRLRSFQNGPFACRENALALTKIEEAIHWLNHAYPVNAQACN
jgi:hypothetical protein